MFSVVCVYNNKKILDECLLKSLKTQSVDFELISLDNTNGKFKSAAEALNYGGKKANGKYIMFVHQDVDLSSETWLADAEKNLNSLRNLGIMGVAGKCENIKGVMTIIEHDNPPELAGDNYISESINVQTLDECLVVIPKSVFDILQFDEKVCDDWHLYSVDYCLSIKKKKYGVYLMPMYVYHMSHGFSFSNKYYNTLNKVLEKHKSYKKIYTTCGDWNTSIPLILQRSYCLAKGVIKRICGIKFK